MTEKKATKKKNLFERELNLLKDSKKVLDNEDVNLEELKEALIVFHGHYEDLLDQSKLITKVSDRLQKKINKANDALELKNNELIETIDALTAARVGRKATTIVLIIFIALFLLMEGLVEPQIDREIAGHPEWGEYGMWIALSIKGVLALLLRPIEKIVEKQLLNREKKKKEQELESNSEEALNKKVASL